MRLPLEWLLGVPQNIHILSSQMLTTSASFQSWQAEKHPKVRRLSFLKAKALYPRFIIWKAFNKGQRCMGGLVDFRGRNDNQIGAKKEMQNGPTKIHVTPENLARYLQLMQIQVNLKIDKTQANLVALGPKIESYVKGCLIENSNSKSPKVCPYLTKMVMWRKVD